MNAHINTLLQEMQAVGALVTIVPRGNANLPSKTIADELAGNFGLRQIGEQWKQIPRQQAYFVIASLLWKDPTGTSVPKERMPYTNACLLSEQFIKIFEDDGCMFLTNGIWNFTEDGYLTDGGYTPLSKSEEDPQYKGLVFVDTGLVVVGETHVGMFWMEDCC